MLYRESVVGGAELKKSCSYTTNEPLFFLKGKQVKKDVEEQIPVSEDLLSKHILLLGGIGSGKTNTINMLTRQLRERMTEDDVMLIFDTKGDYYREFYRPGDIVISNDSRACGPEGKDFWNIFREVTIDGRVEENVMEISRTLFTEKIERSSQPFFPNAAKDLFSALMLDLLRSEERAAQRNNASLRALFDSFSVVAMKRILKHHRDLQAMCSYIDEPGSGQTLGVVAELQQLVREIFVGNFARRGGLSMRQLIRNKGGKVIFVEYDLSIGATLSPIYRLLIDLAIKQALCRSEDEKGSVFFLLDEFRLLPNLKHVDNGVNFGRSLGAKFIIGVQNVDQIAAAYGENMAASLLSGFSTTIAFRVGDQNSRDYVRGLYGKNLKIQSYSSAVQAKGVPENVREASVVEDSDITALKPGQAIVGIMDCEPFLFQFDRYQKQAKSYT